MSTTTPFDVDLMQTAALGDAILSELDRLRELDPIHFSPATGGWLITRHEDVLKGLSGDLPLSTNRLPAIQFLSIPEAEWPARIPNLPRYVPNWIISLDPPAHTRQRKLLVKAFNRQTVERVRPYVRERVASLLEAAESAGEVEFVEGIARQLPGAVILRQLGLPESYVAETQGLGQCLPGGALDFTSAPGVARSGRSGNGGDERDVPAGDR